MIAEDSTVIVMMNEDHSAHTLRVSGKQKLFKRNVDVTCLIGQPYGCIFELQGDSLVRVAETELFDEKRVVVSEGDYEEGRHSTTLSSTVSKGDNRISQTQTPPRSFRRQRSWSCACQERRQRILSRGWWRIRKPGTRRQITRKKYLKKKKKKYLKRFRIVESTPLTLCEVYEEQGARQICAMRPDTLSHILSHSGVHAGCRALVFDGVLGLVVGTVATRMAGEGLILSLYEGQQPRAEVINFLNLSHEDAAIIQPASSVELGPACKDVTEKGFYSDKEEKN